MIKSSLLLFYTFIYLQGSQTTLSIIVQSGLFYTFIYLQGSQTLYSLPAWISCFIPLFTYKALKPQIYYEVITEPIHIGICVSIVRNNSITQNSTKQCLLIQNVIIQLSLSITYTFSQSYLSPHILNSISIKCILLYLASLYNSDICSEVR